LSWGHGLHRYGNDFLLQAQELAVRSLLILTAGFGEGHNAAARNLREAIAATAPRMNVVVSDVFLEAYGWANRLAQKGYLAVINRFPTLWRKAFEMLDRTRIVEQQIGVYVAAGRRASRLITDLRPSVIVSTYPGCNHLLDFIYRRRLKRPFRTVTIITDSLTVNSVWYRGYSDYFLVANQPTADVLLKAGVPDQKIRVLGFPVPRIFASLNGSRSIPPSDSRWRILYVINSGHHMAAEIVRRLLLLENMSLTVTTGRDHDLARRLTPLLDETGKRFDVFGWTPELPRLMAESHLLISKAGGATVQEALAAKVPMIITQIVPGQEEGNARLILDAKAGALATTPREIAAAVDHAFADGAREWMVWQQAASSLSRPTAADDIARFVVDLG
jgi:processive 1,2-diacylglycerol beta-glucosyltransferase